MCSVLTRQLRALSVAAPRAAAATAVPAPIARFQAVNATARPLVPAVAAMAMHRSPLLAWALPGVRHMSGYKLKTKASVKKRFKVNRNGLVKRYQANKRHIATKKTRARLRRLGQPVYLEGKIRKNILKLLRR